MKRRVDIACIEKDIDEWASPKEGYVSGYTDYVWAIAQAQAIVDDVGLKYGDSTAEKSFAQGLALGYLHRKAKEQLDTVEYIIKELTEEATRLKAGIANLDKITV